MAARARWGLVCAVAVWGFEPAVSSLFVGNIDAYNAFLATAMVAAILAGRSRLAGVVWALLTLVKMLPVALLVPALWWRRWRLLQGFAATMAAYFLLLVTTGRLAHEWFFVREVIPAIPSRWRYISIAPGRALVELAGLSERWEDPSFVLAVTRISVGVLVVAYVALLWWLRRRSVGWLRALEFSIIFYPLLSPMLEFHHFVWILPALLLQLRRWAQGAMPKGVAAVLLIGWVILQLQQYLVFQMAKLGQWIHYVSLMACLLIVGALIVEFVKTHPAHEHPKAPAPASAPSLETAR
jgi:hypothetical protein